MQKLCHEPTYLNYPVLLIYYLFAHLPQVQLFILAYEQVKATAGLTLWNYTTIFLARINSIFCSVSLLRSLLGYCGRATGPEAVRHLLKLRLFQAGTPRSPLGPGLKLSSQGCSSICQKFITLSPLPVCGGEVRFNP
jgi:hypothetical protein